MKNLFKAFAGIFGATMIFTSCGGGDGSDGSGPGDLGPASSRSFEGTSISFNPTINFLAGGIVEWINQDTSSVFPQAPASAPLAGRYVYETLSNFRAGRMTVTLNGEDPIFFILEDFVTEDGLVQSFSMEAYGDVYGGRVIQGPLFAAEREGDDSGDSGNGFTFQANGNLTVGTEFTKSFLTGTQQGDITTSPLVAYTVGETADFVIADDGSLVFQGSGGELRLPFVLATVEGILTYRATINEGPVTAVFDTSSGSDEPSDLMIDWTRTFPFQPDALDSKSFSR